MLAESQMISLIFDPERDSNIFLWNVRLSPSSTALQSESPYYSVTAANIY
jgi:hypothetical protein